jgi:hypothetical protein
MRKKKSNTLSNEALKIAPIFAPKTIFKEKTVENQRFMNYFVIPLGFEPRTPTLKV